MRHRDPYADKKREARRPVEESELSVWFVKHQLKNKVLDNTKQGWWYYDGIVWKPLDPTVVTEGLRMGLMQVLVTV